MVGACGSLRPFFAFLRKIAGLLDDSVNSFPAGGLNGAAPKGSKCGLCGILTPGVAMEVTARGSKSLSNSFGMIIPLSMRILTVSSLWERSRVVSDECGSKGLEPNASNLKQNALNLEPNAPNLKLNEPNLEPNAPNL